MDGAEEVEEEDSHLQTGEVQAGIAVEGASFHFKMI